MYPHKSRFIDPVQALYRTNPDQYNPKASTGIQAAQRVKRIGVHFRQNDPVSVAVIPLFKCHFTVRFRVLFEADKHADLQNKQGNHGNNAQHRANHLYGGVFTVQEVVVGGKRVEQSVDQHGDGNGLDVFSGS